MKTTYEKVKKWVATQKVVTPQQLQLQFKIGYPSAIKYINKLLVDNYLNRVSQKNKSFLSVNTVTFLDKKKGKWKPNLGAPLKEMFNSIENSKLQKPNLAYLVPRIKHLYQKFNPDITVQNGLLLNSIIDIFENQYRTVVISDKLDPIEICILLILELSGISFRKLSHNKLTNKDWPELIMSAATINYWLCDFIRLKNAQDSGKKIMEFINGDFEVYIFDCGMRDLGNNEFMNSLLKAAQKRNKKLIFCWDDKHEL